jgi:putative tryptophan/tyrosine transport system substrate-binding protein
LLDLQPDVLLGGSTAVTAALRQETQRIPIVFAVVSDPIGDRFVDSLARPGGNITGFILMEGSMAGKWLALLSEMAPGIKRASMMFNPEFVAGRGSYYLGPFEVTAQSLKLEPITSRVRSDVEIETAMTLLSGDPKGGLVFPPDGFVLLHRERIISLAAKNNIPTVFPNSVYVKDGGLLSYGSDQVDIFRRSASYVDRILRGENPADLPVQLPTKFQLAINLKTANALGLTIPETLLATADEPDVILSPTTAVTAAFQRETRTIPIIFASVSDPVGSGFVAGLPRPGGNLTGFIYAEATMAGKWLALLREIANGVKQAAMFNPDTAPGDGSYYYLPAFETTARSLNVNAIAAPVRSDGEIEAAMTSLAREPRSGLVVMGDSFTLVHRAKIISLGAGNNLPAVYSACVFVRDGGLLSYGPDRADIFRRSATYVDRILRGAKPAELPVEVPIKFEMSINLVTAKSLGLTIPETLLATADEVIQ